MRRECLPWVPMLGARPGEISAEERDGLARHLEGCVTCRARLADVEAVDGLVGEALLREAARRDFSGFADGVMGRIERRRPAGFLRSLWRQHRRAVTIATALAPTLAALALIVYVERDRLWGGGPQPGEVEVTSELLTPMVLDTSDGPLVLLGEAEQPEGT